MANRLSKESSPYLLKHSSNPVDWWPWSQDALEEAKRLDRPLFISIGYFSCHWCSIMERESFEDEKTAAFLNENFINIKIDREEHPDVDKIYQRYYNTLTGENGGWPLTVYAFPDGIPFFIGTYFPKTPSFLTRTRSFMSMNKEIIDSWHNQRSDLEETATGLYRNLDSSNSVLISSRKELQDDIFTKEVQNVQSRLDLVNGGITGAPKFPRYAFLRFLLHHSYLSENLNLRKFTLFSLQKMLQGGIYDQLGGGISRYSVDERWEIPHFEKMLYDNAGLLWLLADTYKLSQHQLFQYYIEDILEFFSREMESKEGTYFSTIDAESEGVEGKFYAWTKSEIVNILSNSELIQPEHQKTVISICLMRYGIKQRGAFTDPHKHIKNHNIPKIDATISEISGKLNIEENSVIDFLNLIKRVLFEFRESRIKPGIDKKILTSWNAMIVTSLFNIAESNEKFQSLRKKAITTLDYILSNHTIENNLVRSKYRNGKIIPAILDDYAFLIDALIQGYETINKWDYILYADRLLTQANELFYNQSQSIYVVNRLDQSTNIGNIISAMDDSFSSSLAIMVKNLYKLGKYLQESSYIERGQTIIENLVPSISNYETAFSELLLAARYYTHDFVEFVIIQNNSAKYNSFNNAILSAYAPIRLIYRWPKDDNRPKWDILEDKITNEEITLYICQGETCSLPAKSVKEVHQLIKEWL